MAAVKIEIPSPDALPPSPSARSMLEEQLERLCSEAGGVCIAEYEGSGDAATRTLVDRARGLLRAALDALDVVTLLFGEADGAAAPDDAGTEADDRLSEPPADGEDLAGTVLLARMGLQRRMRALQALGEHTPGLERLSAAGGALRTVVKALGAVLRGLVGAERPPSSLGFYRRNVERALKIRRRYVELQRQVAGEGPPKADQLRARLRLGGNTIAGLLGQEIAIHLRVEDRALLLVSHGRVRDWLHGPHGDPQHAAAGLRLWQDLLNVTTMFLDVGKREELVEHDAGVVRRVLRELPASPARWSGPAREGALTLLRPLRGRSAALDAVLRAPEGDDLLARLRPALEDLVRAFGRAGLTDDEAPVSGRRSVTRATDGS